MSTKTTTKKTATPKKTTAKKSTAKKKDTVANTEVTEEPKAVEVVQTPTEDVTSVESHANGIQTVSITATSKTSQLVDPESNAHYTFESSETISVPRETSQEDIDQAVEDLWDRVNKRVDDQMDQIYEMYEIE